VKLAIYDDESGSWDAIMSNWNKWTCEQKMAHATAGAHHKMRSVGKKTPIDEPSAFFGA